MKNIHKIHVGSFWLFLTTFSSILAMQIFRLIPPFVRIFCSITFLLCKVDVLLFDICVYCVSFCLHVSEIHRLIVVIMAEIIWSRGRPVELLLDVHQILLDVQQNFYWVSPSFYWTSICNDVPKCIFFSDQTLQKQQQFPFLKKPRLMIDTSKFFIMQSFQVNLVCKLAMNFR